MSRRPRRPRKGAAPPPPRNQRGIVAVNGHATQWVRKGFPWVYPNEVTSGRRPAGEIVAIKGSDGAVLGRGVADDGWLAVRIFRHDDGPLDAAWAADRVDQAVRLRQRVVLGPDTTAARLIHGENDGLPGIRVDMWDRWLVMALASPGVAPVVPIVIDALVAQVDPLGIYGCYRADARDDAREAPEPAPGWWWGAPPDDEVEVRERGLGMRVRPGEGPDVGMYMDMRDVRTWLEPHWAGCRVLNTFAYTGAFSVAAMRAGAASCTTVDLAKPALERYVANAVLNEVDPGEVIEDDTFKALDRLRRKGHTFDRVVVDPPSFSHGPAGTWSTKKDMPRLVTASARVTARDGWLILASNHGGVSPKAFRGQVAEGLRKASRSAREIAFFGAAPDFPAGVSFPEGHYLKVGVWILD